MNGLSTCSPHWQLCVLEPTCTYPLSAHSPTLSLAPLLYPLRFGLECKFHTPVRSRGSSLCEPTSPMAGFTAQGACLGRPGQSSHLLPGSSGTCGAGWFEGCVQDPATPGQGSAEWQRGPFLPVTQHLGDEANCLSHRAGDRQGLAVRGEKSRFHNSGRVCLFLQLYLFDGRGQERANQGN